MRPAIATVVATAIENCRAASAMTGAKHQSNPLSTVTLLRQRRGVTTPPVIPCARTARIEPPVIPCAAQHRRRCTADTGYSAQFQDSGSAPHHEGCRVASGMTGGCRVRQQRTPPVIPCAAARIEPPVIPCARAARSGAPQIRDLEYGSVLAIAKSRISAAAIENCRAASGMTGAKHQSNPLSIVNLGSIGAEATLAAHNPASHITSVR